MAATNVSLAAVRRLAIAAQGYASRYRVGTTTEVETAVQSLSCVQLDSISTVERSHRIAWEDGSGASRLPPCPGSWHEDG